MNIGEQFGDAEWQLAEHVAPEGLLVAALVMTASAECPRLITPSSVKAPTKPPTSRTLPSAVWYA